MEPEFSPLQLIVIWGNLWLKLELNPIIPLAPNTGYTPFFNCFCDNVCGWYIWAILSNWDKFLFLILLYSHFNSPFLNKEDTKEVI